MQKNLDIHNLNNSTEESWFMDMGFNKGLKTLTYLFKICVYLSYFKICEL